MPKRTHGLSRTPEWAAWRAAKLRCESATDAAYKNYGGRGVRMCRRWSESFLAFLGDLGKRPSEPGVRYSLDRKDNGGHYSCGKCRECKARKWLANCRWATLLEQHNNTRANTFLETGGEKKTIAQWARVAGVRPELIIDRLKFGWTAREAIHTPAKSQPGLCTAHPSEFQAWWRAIGEHKRENGPWSTFEAFLKDVGLKPTPTHVLLRRDSTQEYGPGNCYWGDRSERNRQAWVTRKGILK